MATCLSCVEIEEKICALSEEITSSSCDVLTREGDTVIDNTAALKAKVEVLRSYQRMYESRNCGTSDELFEFVHVPCVTPHTCVSRSCNVVPRIRNQRRYR